MTSADRFVATLRRQLADAGLSGSFLVRNLADGAEIGIEADLVYPVASLVKVPLAVAVLNRVEDGRIDGATMIDVEPGRVATAGPMGLTKFRHPVRIAVDDLLYLSTAVSDNTAADALFALVPPAEVNRALRDAGIAGIAVRHLLRDLVETPTERFEPAEVHLAHSVAIGAQTSRGGHAVPQLDVSRANTGTARAFVDLLEALWVPSRIAPGVAARTRSLMADNVVRHRLTPDFVSDAARWSAKTGTLLNLRHEVGVVEHDDGGVFAVAAFTASTVPASAQPAAEATMGQVARALHDHLRAR
ncbi:MULTISPECIES: serine hydrolase [Micromonospora]|uniref:Beta-lactamase class A n=1 Tax=Micromonospora yangpuensis TaxID=683228 RepID=A0A1C6U2F0_9ACTN|nr:serine hydrolase [Micromonospora yangpuensis]GGM10529.1 serine hydrolase [Micromonospora yangpuensis]SCL48088.1 beta-lactamase class A [Micromonospora yangpuensis]